MKETARERKNERDSEREKDREKNITSAIAKTGDILVKGTQKATFQQKHCTIGNISFKKDKTNRINIQTYLSVQDFCFVFFSSEHSGTTIYAREVIKHNAHQLERLG